MKFFKWLASFESEDEANEFLFKAARGITTAGLTKEFSVKLEKDRFGREIYVINLYKADQ